MTELKRPGSYISLTRAETCSDNPTPSETGSVINSPKFEVIFDYTEEQNKEKAKDKKNRKSWKQTYCATGMTKTLIKTIVLCCILGGLAYISYLEFYPRYKEAAKEHQKRKNGTSSHGHGRNTTILTQTLLQRDIPKFILLLWTDDLDKRDDAPYIIPTIPPVPGAKPDCSMSKKNQCYTGHKCYKRYCVSWCRDNSDCLEGHTCLRADSGTSWKVCSLNSDVQVPCAQNYKYCKEDNDCCTGSCQRRGKYMVCVPPEKFERTVMGDLVEE